MYQYTFNCSISISYTTAIISGVAPTFGRPLMTAMVAGTAPPVRTMDSTARAVSRFCAPRAQHRSGTLS